MRLGQANGFNHGLALVVVRGTELFPPLGQGGVYLTGLRAQAQKIKPSAKARLLQQRIGRSTHALFKACLQGPDLTHVDAELATARYITDFGVKSIVNRILQRGHGVLATFEPLGPAVTDIRPQHARQQKARCHWLAFAHAAVSVQQRQVQKRLVGSFNHHIEQGVNACPQAQSLELCNAGQRVAGLQQFEHLVKQARLGHVSQQPGHLTQGSGSFVLKSKPQRMELGGKTHRANDAYRVFAVAHRRVANHADDFFLGVPDAVVVVHHHLGLGVVVHGVDGEIAPGRVLDHRAPDVVAQHPARAVNRMRHACQLAFAGALIAADLFGLAAVKVGAKRRHLNDFMLSASAIDDMNNPKAPTNDEGTAKQPLDLFWRGIGGYIKVFGSQPDQQVTHGTADDISLKTSLFQGVYHVPGALVHQFWVDAMVCNSNVLTRTEGGFFDSYGACCGAVGFTKQLVDEFFNHENAELQESTCLRGCGLD